MAADTSPLAAPAAPTASAGGAGDAPAWRQRDFMLLWGGMCMSTLGSEAAGIAYPLLVLAISGSPAMVGLIAALRTTPYLILCLPVGAMVDRWDRRQVMLRCELGCAAAVASLPLAMALSQVTLAHIALVAVVEGTLGVFYNLAEVAALPRTVARHQLHQATAMNHAGFAAAGIAGPSLGTLLLQAWRGLPFVADALSYLASGFTLWRLRGDFAPPPATAPRHLLDEVKTGLRWLWRDRLVRTIAMLTGGLNFAHAAMPLLLIVSAKQLGAGESQIGAVFSAAGVGGVLGALVGGRLQQRFSFGAVIGTTVLVQTLLMPLVSWCTSVWALGAVYGLMMLCRPVYNVVQFSHRLALIPPGLEGRVNAGFRFTAHLLFPAGAALSGWMIEHHGTGPTVMLFATVFVVCSTVAVGSRAIRHEQRRPLRGG